MTNIIYRKKWKKWYPNECQELNSTTDSSVSLKNSGSIIVDDNMNNIFTPLSHKMVSSDTSVHTLNNFDSNIIYDVCYKKNILNEVNNIKEQKQLMSEQKKFFSTIEKFIQDFQSSLNVLDDMVSERLLNVVLTLTKSIIGETSELEKKVLLHTIRNILDQNVVSFKKVKLHIHSKNQLVINESFGDIINSYGWTIFLDDSMSIYGCKLSLFDGSELDYSINNRLDVLSQLIVSEEKSD